MITRENTMKEKGLTHSKLRTDTTRFLLPTTGLKRYIVDTEDFVNAYLFTNTFENKSKSVIILVYTNTNIELSKTGYKALYDGKYYYYFVPVNPVTMDKFLKGEYSKFTDKEKEQILKFWNLIKHSRMYNILYPDDYMFEIGGYTNHKLFHKREIWPKPDTRKETFII